MKKITYMFISAALLYGCEEFYGSLDGGSQEITEIAAINRSSMPVRLNVYGADWAEPEDTIYLKPHNGVWKIEEARVNYYGQDILPVQYSVIRADFNDGERTIYFDMFSDLPHNPCAIGAKEIWDDRTRHRLIEFSDEICGAIYAHQDRLHTFDISLEHSPSDAVDSLVTPGSTEGHFTSVFPAGKVKDRLQLGAVVHSEAESIDRIRFADGLKYEADTLAGTPDTTTLFQHIEIYPYYGMDQLRKLGLTNFGCDFAALTGRADGRFDSFCGIVLLQVQRGLTEEIQDREHQAEFIGALESLPEPVCVVDRIEYGNLMILLAEADCSHTNIHTYVTQKLLRDAPYGYYPYEEYHTPEIRFHLITLDDDGSFVCQSGGEELAETFYKGYETPALHPLSFHVTNLKDDSADIHIAGL